MLLVALSGARSAGDGERVAVASDQHKGGGVDAGLGRRRAALRLKVVESMGAARWDDAARDLADLLLLEPGDVECLLNLGQVRQRQGDVAAAIGFYREAVRRESENAAGWMMLGLAEMERGEVLRACASLAMGVAIEPGSARGHRWYGMALARRGWNDAAEAELKRSLELDGKDSGAHFNLALLYLNRKEPAYGLARYHYMTAVDLGGERDDVVEALLEKGGKSDGEAKGAAGGVARGKPEATR
jgi:Flp pilus assembly protein TadD